MKLDESQFKDTQKLVRQLLKDSTHLYDLPIASYEVPVYEHPSLNDLGVWGFAQCHPDYRIFIDARVPKHQRRRTIWHEAIEVVNDVFDLGLNETKIRVLEQSLWQVMQKKKL